MRKIGFLVSLIICGLFLSVYVDAQYYYFDTGTSTYPYQQGCSEQLYVRINTQASPSHPIAGLLRLLFDPVHFSYSKSNLASDLQNDLFNGSSETFSFWTSPTGTPSWVSGSDNTILQVDRNNGTIGYAGSNGMYGTIKFIPLYNQISYTGLFNIIYDGSTVKTTLSYGGTNIIQSAQQNSRLTGAYAVLQEPCVGDSQAPQISISTPIDVLSKQNNVSGINITLTDNSSSSASVPYVWTGGGIWTGNVWNIDAERGIDISTLQITIAGNGNSRTFNGGTYATANGKTWQFLDKNYTVSIPSAQLFDYGIEKTINMTVSVRDRLGKLSSRTIAFNNPVAPTISNRFPAANSNFVALDSPVSFDISDDWAGVNTGTLTVNMSAVKGGVTVWGPYIFTGTQISNHIKFPSSATVTVNVQVRDNVDNLLNTSWSFSTRPNCLELGCCEDKKLNIKNNISDLFANPLYIAGGRNPFLSWIPGENTGYINCGLENDGLSVYRGEDNSGATFVSYITSDKLVISYNNPNNLRVVLSGNTVYLSKLFDYGTLSEIKGGWGGGMALSMDNCPDGDKSPSYYDLTCQWDGHYAADFCGIKDSPYSQEVNDAFQYAYSVGMTNICPIQKANLDSMISRIFLAKMLVEYSVNVVGLYPDVTKKGCEFEDMKNYSSEMKFYARLACQLDLMGLENDGITPQKKFYPEGTVNRAQFGTILSRLIFGYYYNIKDNENVSYYVHHLDALKRNNIIKNIDPNIKEKKVYIMLMLKRAYETGLIDQGRFSTASKNGINAMFYK